MWAALGTGEATWLGPSCSPFTYIFPVTPNIVGFVHEIFRRHHGTETIEREKLSGREKSAREIPSLSREVITIVTVIMLDFIEIIIIIHHTLTIILTDPLCPAVTSSDVPCLVHCGDLFLVVDAIEFYQWIKVYVQIIIHHHIISDHDPYDVL